MRPVANATASVSASWPPADEVAASKSFTAKACAYGGFVLLLYFTMAAIWCMCNMPMQVCACVCVRVCVPACLPACLRACVLDNGALRKRPGYSVLIQEGGLCASCALMEMLL